MKIIFIIRHSILQRYPSSEHVFDVDDWNFPIPIKGDMLKIKDDYFTVKSRTIDTFKNTITIHGTTI